MSIDEPDFLRRLELALAGNPYSINDRVARFRLGDGEVSIAYAPRTPRRLGRLTLAVLAVDISFDGVDECDQKTFIKQFDKSFQRGGG
jgi:hypothetical protein